jgi:hypothetical protein
VEPEDHAPIEPSRLLILVVRVAGIDQVARPHQQRLGQDPDEFELVQEAEGLCFEVLLLLGAPRDRVPRPRLHEDRKGPDAIALAKRNKVMRSNDRSTLALTDLIERSIAENPTIVAERSATR